MKRQRKPNVREKNLARNQKNTIRERDGVHGEWMQRQFKYETRVKQARIKRSSTVQNGYLGLLRPRAARHCCDGGTPDGKRPLDPVARGLPPDRLCVLASRCLCGCPDRGHSNRPTMEGTISGDKDEEPFPSAAEDTSA
ncbi:unnamed protein product [Prorocentrum cordatum]|uniref:Uncharacterized protein n=1 Tax=Prorocentrum cordatum TaxID=2364126 RepID=A0ABN9RLE0_9DINO|nr:unnamed protein product [Polarella glacialis]